jgi:nucleoside-diphosphate-sugar epimerase
MSLKKKAFVTGATGFLGLNLIEQLCLAGYEVTALHRPTSDLRFLSRFDVKRVVGTITDKATLDIAMEDGVDVVFHVAANTSVWARNNATQTRDNVDGTRNMVNVALAKGAKRFVHTSSSSVFGLGEGPFSEDSPLLGRRSWINYLRTKSLADDVVREAASRGLSTAIMRPANIMGKYDRHNWAKLIRLVARGKLLGIPSGSGCFCNGGEVAKAHIRAAQRDTGFEVFVLGGPRATLVELVGVIGEITGKKAPNRATPDIVLRAAAGVFVAISALTGKEPPGTPEGVAVATHNSRVDDNKARKELGYAHVPLHETVRQSYEFLRDEALL